MAVTSLLVLDQIRNYMNDHEGEGITKKASVVALGSLVSLTAGAALNEITSDQSEVKSSFSSFRIGLRKSATFVLNTLIMRWMLNVSFELAETFVSWVLLQKYGSDSKLWKSIRQFIPFTEKGTTSVLEKLRIVKKKDLNSRAKEAMREFKKDPATFIESKVNKIL